MYTYYEVKSAHVMPKLSLILILFLVVLVLSCEADENSLQEGEFTSFSIKDMGEFQLDDSVLFATHSDSTYYLNILTQPAGAPVYLSTNQQAFKLQTEEWLRIDSSISTVKLSPTKNSSAAYHQNKVKTIRFGFGQTDLITAPFLYPNPVKDSIAYAFTGKSRGLVQMQIFDLRGLKVETFNALKASDDFIQKRSLDNLPAGIYLIRLYYGDASLLYRMIKE